MESLLREDDLGPAMTLENAAAGLAHGDAKSVMWGDPRTQRGCKEKRL
jgi:glutamate dehydrogenase/leucine dehydrogenase